MGSAFFKTHYNDSTWNGFNCEYTRFGIQNLNILQFISDSKLSFLIEPEVGIKTTHSQWCSIEKYFQH